MNPNKKEQLYAKILVPGLFVPGIVRFNKADFRAGKMELNLKRPDDWHLHLRDGDLLAAVAPYSARHFGRAIIMPNLRPPVTTTAAAITYRESIMKVLPDGSDFNPLMTLYLTDKMEPDEIKLAIVGNFTWSL